jgi:predicted dehydrogenase
MTSSSAEPIRAGIIGLSWISADAARPASTPVLGTSSPYSHASAMAAHGGIDVTAVCDLRAEARDAFVDEWGSTWPQLVAHADIDEMLSTPLDLVSVVTPDHLHGPMIERCLDAGVSMIFAEKPFTTSLTEADELLAKIEAAGATVSVNHTWRWRPDVAEASSIIRSGRLGPLSQVIVEAGGPRAMLFRNLSHFLDLALHLTDSPPRWVVAELEEGTGDYGLVYAGDGGRDPGLDPGANVLIGMDGGVRAFVSGLKASVPDVSVQVVCRDGRITLDFLGGRIVEVPRTGDGTPGSASGPTMRPLQPKFTVAGMQAGLGDLIQAHRSGTEPSSSARSVRSTVAVIDAVLRSHAGGMSKVAVAPPPNAHR